MISPNNRVGRDKLGSVFFSHSHEIDQCVANAESHWLKEGGLGQSNRGKEPLEKDTLKPQYALTLPTSLALLGRPGTGSVPFCKEAVVTGHWGLCVPNTV